MKDDKPIKTFLVQDYESRESEAMAWVEAQKEKNFLLWTFLRLEFNLLTGNFEVFDNEGINQ